MSVAASALRFAVANLIGVAVLIPTYASDDKVKIDVRRSASAIQQELLHFTPLGSNVDQVAEFVLARLYYEGGYTSGVGIMPRPGLRVTLGHRPSVSPISHTSVAAEWIFDENLKLRRIGVEEMQQEGSYDPRETPNGREKIHLDLRHSDDAIRRQLLELTPVGSSLTDIGFLARLYFIGGPASGVAVTGKPGWGVVLGHYFDAKVGCEKAVLVTWVRDREDRLRDIDVERVDWTNLGNR